MSFVSFRENFPKIFAKIRNKNNPKFRGISFREIFVATLMGGLIWAAVGRPQQSDGSFFSNLLTAQGNNANKYLILYVAIKVATITRSPTEEPTQP